MNLALNVIKILRHVLLNIFSKRKCKLNSLDMHFVFVLADKENNTIGV